MIPSDTPNSSFLAQGNAISCDVNGFFVTVGSAAVPMYTSSLCIYYLCRIKLGMNDEAFSRVERGLHIFIIGFNCASGIIGLVTNTFNSLGIGLCCSFAGYPLNCDFDPDEYGECTRGRDAFKYTLIFTLLPFILSLLVIAVSMSMMCWYVLQQRKLHSTSTDTTCRSYCCMSSCKREEISWSVEQRQRENETVSEFADRLQRVYVRETMKQASLYFLAFIGVYFMPLSISICNIILRFSSSHKVILATTIVYPLGGLFNIFVYTRPKVRHVLRRNPEFSFLQALWVVVKSGGDLPDESTLQQMSRQFEENAPCCRRFFIPVTNVSEMTGMSDFQANRPLRRRGQR
jgi:hypothetical protein